MESLKNNLIIQLIPLGTCSANKNPFQKYSSYLIEGLFNKKTFFQIILDVGNNRAIYLDDNNYNYPLEDNNMRYRGIIKPDLLKAIFISHSHLDHSRYLYELLINLKNYYLKKSSRMPNKINLTPATPKIKIILHKNAFKLYKRWKKLENLLHFKKINFTEVENANIFEFIYPDLPLRPKKQINFGFNNFISLDPLYIELENCPDKSKIMQINSEDPKNSKKLKIEISVANAIHNPNTLAYRLNFIYTSTIQSKNMNPLFSIVYSPDTRFDSTNLVEFAKNADYWLLDTTFSNNFIEKHKNWVKLTHSSPKFSAILCEKAQVKNYVVCHYFWKRFSSNYNNFDKFLKKEIGDSYSGNIIIAKDLKIIQLWPPKQKNM
ncbi:MAG: MBL fold metallo-hydrolase [Promethearchaeota archaeon]